MNKRWAAGIALGVLVGAAVMVAPSAQADTADAKKALMAAIDKCEMQQKTDARESCMDEAWAAYKKAAKK